MELEKTRKSVIEKKINWQNHALARMLERGISRDEVKEVILYGEIIEEYSNDYPFPSCLMFYKDIKPLHVVLSYDKTNHVIYIITAYQPDLNHFETDLKTRRQQ
jgi:hypothetical protein